ncbi:Protein of unknown function [Bacillus cereus]
MEEAW